MFNSKVITNIRVALKKKGEKSIGLMVEITYITIIIYAKSENTRDIVYKSWIKYNFFIFSYLIHVLLEKQKINYFLRKS